MMLANWSQVRRDDVSAQQRRPGQQNRRETPIPASGSKDRGHQEAESREIQKESEEAGQPPSANSSSSAITPQERQLYKYISWHTATPPPLTVFLRPYLDRVRQGTRRDHAMQVDLTEEDAQQRTEQVPPRRPQAYQGATPG